jgi:hypothetical protein
MEGLLLEGSSAFEDETVSGAVGSRRTIRAAGHPQLGDNGKMNRPGAAISATILLVAAGACGGRPAELVPPVGEPVVIDPSAEFPRIRFSDGLASANDVCPVTKRKLSPYFPPVYVNGLPIGFC